MVNNKNNGKTQDNVKPLEWKSRGYGNMITGYSIKVTFVLFLVVVYMLRPALEYIWILFLMLIIILPLSSRFYYKGKKDMNTWILTGNWKKSDIIDIIKNMKEFTHTGSGDTFLSSAGHTLRIVSDGSTTSLQLTGGNSPKNTEGLKSGIIKLLEKKYDNISR